MLTVTLLCGTACSSTPVSLQDALSSGLGISDQPVPSGLGCSDVGGDYYVTVIPPSCGKGLAISVSADIPATFLETWRTINGVPVELLRRVPLTFKRSAPCVATIDPSNIWAHTSDNAQTVQFHWPDQPTETTYNACGDFNELLKKGHVTITAPPKVIEDLGLHVLK